MSKIYEALQRAELDRKATDGGRPAPPVPAASTSLLVEPMPGDGANLFGEPPQGVFTAPASNLLSTRAAISEADALPVRRPLLREGLNLDAVPMRQWKPLLESLPAVQERGGALEQFRTLRSRMYEFRDLNPLKSILVTSGLPQEGKSFVAVNLALTLARHKGSRVLLIDGDMRRPSLQKLLGCPPEPGLAEYLASKSTLLEVMQRSEKGMNEESESHAGLINLTFIPAGNGGDRVADLSGSRRFDELVEAAAPYFDWIVVDSSPVNMVADGANLARACDAALLIVRSGVTQFATAQRAQSKLKASKILGVVLNAVKTPLSSDNYYGYDSKNDSTTGA